MTEPRTSNDTTTPRPQPRDNLQWNEAQKPSVPAALPVRHVHVLMSQPVMQHAFAVFASICLRFKNRKCEQHGEAYSESDQTGDRFSVHGSLL